MLLSNNCMSGIRRNCISAWISFDAIPLLRLLARLTCIHRSLRHAYFFTVLYTLIACALAVLCFGSCTAHGYKAEQALDVNQDGKLAAYYYWRTVFSLSPSDSTLAGDKGRLNDLRPEHLYLRLFDVDYIPMVRDGQDPIRPIGTIQFADSVPRDMAVTPVVYITEEAISSMQGREEHYAELIVRRVDEICSSQGIRYKELQFDCDWAKSTEGAFFSLCRFSKQILDERGLDLSSTLRLHQLRSEVPPVDRVSLMVYNTGAITKTNTRNSIIAYEDVAPYFRRSVSYPLEMSVAYPFFGWGVWFRSGNIQGLLKEVDWNNRELYRRIERSEAQGEWYLSLQRHFIGLSDVQEGDLIRRESPNIAELRRIKSLIEGRLSTKPSHTILYDYSSIINKHQNISQIQDSHVKEMFSSIAPHR